MRTLINFTLAIALLFFIGCTVESLEDSALEERNLTTEAIRNMPFVIEGYGELIVSPAQSDYNVECEGYTLIMTEGISSEQTLGRFTTTTRICTDRDDYYRVRGVHRFPNGEELYFHAVIEVETNGSKEVMCVFDGGTGRFEGATGMVNLVEEMIFHDANEGTYTNHGEGTIMMGK